MPTYILRRMLLMAPTLIGVLAVVFFVMAFAPGGFGVRTLGEEGAMQQGEDARRAQQRLKRRYGADLPIYQQFGRWLNQVSPVGFRMSADLEFDDDARTQVADTLAPLDFNTRPRRLDDGVNLVLNLAAYTASPPADTARDFAQDLQRFTTSNPLDAAALDAAMAWFDAIDADLSPSLQARLREELVQRATESPASAQSHLIRELAFEVAGVSRIRFDRPAFKTPDLGQTLQNRQVSELIFERVQITILLNAITIPIIYLIAVVSGLYAARHRGKLIDTGSGIFFIGLWSLPVIWTGVVLITYLANEQYVRIFPTGGLNDLLADGMPFFPQWGEQFDGGFTRGWLLDRLWHLVLPILCLTYTGFAVLSRVMRGSILDVLSADYVRTARAKGLPETEVLWRHVFRNSILPLITMAAAILPALFAGSVIVETIFSINGLGRLGVEAAFQKDRDLVMATTLIAAMLKLVAELVRDICYAIADPRVTYE